MIQIPTMKDKIAVIRYMNKTGWQKLGMTTQKGKKWQKVQNLERHNRILLTQHKQQYLDTTRNKNLSNSKRKQILFATVLQTREERREKKKLHLLRKGLEGNKVNIVFLKHKGKEYNGPSVAVDIMTNIEIRLMSETLYPGGWKEKKIH